MFLGVFILAFFFSFFKEGVFFLAFFFCVFFAWCFLYSFGVFFAFFPHFWRFFFWKRLKYDHCQKVRFYWEFEQKPLIIIQQPFSKNVKFFISSLVFCFLSKNRTKGVILERYWAKTPFCCFCQKKNKMCDFWEKFFYGRHIVFILLFFIKN